MPATAVDLDRAGWRRRDPDLKPGEAAAIVAYQDRNHVLLSADYAPADAWDGATARAAFELTAQRAETLLDEFLGDEQARRQSG